MRYAHACTMGAVGLILAGCGSSSSSSPTPPATQAPVKVATVPQTSPVPVKTAKTNGGPPPGRTTGITKLPTAQPIVVPTATAIPANAFTATLHGTVKDSQSHSPLAGAIVLVGVSGNHKTLTNGQGQFRISFPAGINAAVQIRKPGYMEYLAMGLLGSHKAQRLDVTLQRIAKGVAPQPPTFFRG